MQGGSCWRWSSLWKTQVHCITKVRWLLGICQDSFPEFVPCSCGAVAVLSALLEEVKDLPQGGPEIPCSVLIVGESKDIHNRNWKSWWSNWFAILLVQQWFIENWNNWDICISYTPRSRFDKSVETVPRCITVFYHETHVKYRWISVTP